MVKIFVSVAGEDLPWAREFTECLEKWVSGVQCYVHHEDNRFSRDFQTDIIGEIADSQQVVVLCTPEGVKKPWIVFEIGLAYGIRRGDTVPIIPIGIRNYKVETMEEVYLKAPQGYDANLKEDMCRFLQVLISSAKLPAMDDARLDACAAELVARVGSSVYPAAESSVDEVVANRFHQIFGGETGLRQFRGQEALENLRRLLEPATMRLKPAGETVTPFRCWRRHDRYPICQCEQSADGTYMIGKDELLVAAVSMYRHQEPQECFVHVLMSGQKPHSPLTHRQSQVAIAAHGVAFEETSAGVCRYLDAANLLIAPEGSPLEKGSEEERRGWLACLLRARHEPTGFAYDLDRFRQWIDFLAHT